MVVQALVRRCKPVIGAARQHHSRKREKILRFCLAGHGSAMHGDVGCGQVWLLHHGKPWKILRRSTDGRRMALLGTAVLGAAVLGNVRLQHSWSQEQFLGYE